MSISSQGRPLAGLPARIGQILAAPRAALGRIELEGGGLTDAVWLVLLGTLSFRLPELCRALLALGGPASGAFLRLLGLFADEAKEAAWVVLPAATIVTIAAGPRRDASRDLDLGAACYAPYFAVREIGRMLAGLTGATVVPIAVAQTVAGAGAALVLYHAVRTARGRRLPERDRARPGGEPSEPAAPQPTAGSAPGRAARVAGAAVMTLALVSFAGNAIWIGRHLELLQPMRRGERAPEFALDRIDGQSGTLALAPLHGQVVVLDFWATWCPPCVAMLPVLDASARRWGPRGVAFLGINSDGGGTTRADIEGFLVEHPIPYPVGIDDGQVGALYKIEALPTLVVVGRDGTIRKSFVGYTSKRALDGALEDALREPAALSSPAGPPSPR